MTISIKSPRWANEAHTIIDCDITINGETRPFTASPDDVVKFGRDVFQMIVAGGTENIAEWSPPKHEEKPDVPIILSPKRDPDVEIF